MSDVYPLQQTVCQLLSVYPKHSRDDLLFEQDLLKIILSIFRFTIDNSDDKISLAPNFIY